MVTTVVKLIIFSVAVTVTVIKPWGVSGVVGEFEGLAPISCGMIVMRLSLVELGVGVSTSVTDAGTGAGTAAGVGIGADDSAAEASGSGIAENVAWKVGWIIVGIGVEEVDGVDDFETVM